MTDLAFIGKLFGPTPLSRVWVGWHDGTGGFPGGPADKYLGRLPSQAGRYFCIGRLKPGSTRRQRSDIEAICCLVLDDIGTKALDTADIRRVLGKPTWIMETSAGNFQWGWVYGVAVSDFGRHAAVVRECHRRWGVDLAGADRNRVVRLPSGVNVKPGRGGFGVRLVETNEAVRVDLVDLYVALDLDWNGPGVAEEEFDLADLGRVSLGDADRDVWISAIIAAGLALHDNPNGTIEMTCPWAADHTDLREGTAYLGEFFKCQHAHCAGRRTGDFKEAIKKLVNLCTVLVEMTPPEEQKEEDEYIERKALEHMFDPPPRPGAKMPKSGALAYESEAEAVQRLIYAHEPERFVDEPTGKIMTAKQTDEAMWQTQENRMQRGQKAPSNTLLIQSRLRKVDHITYRPGLGKIVVDELEKNLSAVNTWQAPVLVRAVPGRWLKVILDHVDRLFPDPDYARAITNWLAALVQNPATRVAWMPIVIGVGGTGKDVLFGALRGLLGPTNVVKLGTERLLDEDSRFKAFTGHQVVILEELSMTLVKGKDVATILKPLITEDRVFGRGVYEGSTTKPNTASVLAYSNTENALNISPDRDDQRRYLPYISPARALSKGDADELVDAVEKGCGELLGFLLDRDLAKNGWDPYRKPDITVSHSAAATMAAAGASGPAKEVVDLIDGRFCDRTLITAAEITDALRARRVGTSALHALGDGMSNAGFVRWKDTQTRFGAEGRSRVWVKKGVDVVNWTDDRMRAAVAAERAAMVAPLFSDDKIVPLKKG